MRKVFITVLLLAITLFSSASAQTSQVSYNNGDSIPLFQGTLAYQEGFSHDSLANYIISSDEAFYSAQYYGERADSPNSIKLAVLDNYVVWQFDFVDQVICIDAQDATNAYALPVDGITYTYVIEDFSNSNAVYSSTQEATSYVSNNSSAVMYGNTAQTVQTTQASQENYNISSGGYNDLYNGYATYQEYLAAYTAQAQAYQQSVTAAPVSSYSSETVYVASANTSSIQPAVQSPATGYGAQGYDDEGYDPQGYDRAGYDREGYTSEGYSAVGYDRDGYNRAGYNPSGYDRDGYNNRGFNASGYNREGQTQ